MATIRPPAGMELPGFQKRRPILESLAGRPTIFLREPLIAKVLKESRFQELVTVSPFEVVKEKWGRKLAEGIVDKMVAEMERKGVKVSPNMREAMIDAWATVVTRGLLE